MRRACKLPAVDRVDKDKIVKLLRTSDMSMKVIGKRFGVTATTVHNINAEEKIREYLTVYKWLVDGTIHQYEH